MSSNFGGKNSPTSVSTSKNLETGTSVARNSSTSSGGAANGRTFNVKAFAFLLEADNATLMNQYHILQHGEGIADICLCLKGAMPVFIFLVSLALLIFRDPCGKIHQSGPRQVISISGSLVLIHHSHALPSLVSTCPPSCTPSMLTLPFLIQPARRRSRPRPSLQHGHAAQACACNSEP